MVWVQYPRRNTASSRLNHCNCFSQYHGSLAGETENQDRRFAHLATCRCGASAVLSSNGKSLVIDENTREWQVWSTKLMTKSRAEFWTHHFVHIHWGSHFFWSHPYIWSTTVLHNIVLKTTFSDLGSSGELLLTGIRYVDNTLISHVSECFFINFHDSHKRFVGIPRFIAP